MKPYKAFGIFLVVPWFYSVTAVCSFLLIHSPTAGLHALPGAIIYSFIVTIPYVLLGLASYIARDETTFIWIGVMLALATLLALFFYSASFKSNDGEYAIVYLSTPILQTPFVLTALAVSIWRRRRVTVNG